MNHIVTGGFSSIEQATGTFGGNCNTANKAGAFATTSFEDILTQKQSINETKQQEIRFSKHAGERLEQRDIQLTGEQMKRLKEGTQKAGQKGIRESLVLLDDLAFIVNTKNNIVITAMYKDAGDENIYTNIDGAVII